VELVAPCFHSGLVVEKVGVRNWLFREHLVYETLLFGPPAPGRNTLIVLPKGSVVNFGSTPRILWTWLPPTGQYDWGTALHDGGYNGLLYAGRFVEGTLQLRSHIHLARHLCDKLMDEANEAVGVSERDRRILYHGCRLFAGGAYHGARHA